MNINLNSKISKGIILGIACLIILGFVFGLGVFVGLKKADFSFKWADQYHRNFGGGFTNSNGVFGQIIKINDNSLTVKDKDNVEKIILTDSKTTIVSQRTNIKLSDLDVDDMVVVIGNPNSNGQIEAKLIRVMPVIK